MEIPQGVCEKCRPLFEIVIRKITELEKRLLAYENAHTPSSRDRRRYPKREPTGNPIGAPKGHKGVTRETPKPTESKTLYLDNCPYCHNPLGKPEHIRRKVIEELPDPRPIRVIEFFVPHYHCSHCNKEVIATDSELPDEGRLGYNLQTQIALMKYEDRLPHRKIVNSLNRQHDLRLTPATILDVTRRVADKLRGEYGQIEQEVKKAPQVNADETGAKVNGEKHWFWGFMSLTSVLFLLRKRRNAKVVKAVLGEDYKGILTCDGLKAYQIIKIIQRCWAHLLRESKFLAQKHKGQARVLYNGLCELFKKIKKVTLKTPMKRRGEIQAACIKKMRLFVRIAKAYQELRKIATTIENGMKNWFTCVLHPEIEPTNNRMERALREFVIQRKIMGTLRNEKGMRIVETIMSVLGTWRLRGLNTYSMLRQTLSS